MARGHENARHDDRRPFIDPWFAAEPSGTTVFAGSVPGYSQPDAIDPTGYSLQDLELPGRIADGMIPDDVLAPLGPTRNYGKAPEMGTVGTPGDELLVGDVSPGTYGSYAGPQPGGALADESRVYGPAFGYEPKLMAAPGAVAHLADLGMDPTGLAPLTTTDFVTGHHSQGAAPLEYQSGPNSMVSPEHLQSTLETGLDIYGGYQGLLNPGDRGGADVYGGLYDGLLHPSTGTDGTQAAAPAFHGGKGGAFGPAALSMAGRPLFREVDPGDEYDIGVDPATDPGWRSPTRTRPPTGLGNVAYPNVVSFEGNR